MSKNIEQLLGKEAQSLLSFDSPIISKQQLHLPHAKFIEQTFVVSSRSKTVQRNLLRLRNAGRLKKTGYYSILPVDQGIEHGAGFSFAPNPDYFDPENIVRLAIEGGCNGVATTFGVLSAVSKKYADKIPLIMKINHNDLLRYPNDYDQTIFASVEQACELGAAGIGATIYFGSPESKRQIQEVSYAFERAHQLGMFTILWCYTRNDAFVYGKNDYHASADITGQAIHLGATIGADIVKQKLPTTNGIMSILNRGKKSYSKVSDDMNELIGTHPIDLCRYQVMNAYAGRIGLINSGGASTGENDVAAAVRAAVINKRAGGSGLIMGRKAFQKPLKEGIDILNAVQDVYLDDSVTVA